MMPFIYKLGYPLARIYWYIVRPHTFGAKVVIERDEKVLLVMHTYGPQFWSFPGGGKKRGETLEMTARRETKEEVGLELTDVEYIGEFTSRNEHKHDHVLVFRGKAVGEPRVDHDEIAAYEWESPDNTRAFTPVGRLVLDLYAQSRRSHIAQDENLVK